MYIVSCAGFVLSSTSSPSSSSSPSSPPSNAQKYTFYLSEDDLNKGAGAFGGPGLGAEKGECVIAVQNSLESLVLGDAGLKGVVVVLDAGGRMAWVLGMGVEV